MMSSQTMKRPHLIQILSDEHCGFALSCAGNPDVGFPSDPWWADAHRCVCQQEQPVNECPYQ